MQGTLIIACMAAVLASMVYADPLDIQIEDSGQISGVLENEAGEIFYKDMVIEEDKPGEIFYEKLGLAAQRVDNVRHKRQTTCVPCCRRQGCGTCCSHY